MYSRICLFCTKARRTFELNWAPPYEYNWLGSRDLTPIDLQTNVLSELKDFYWFLSHRSQKRISHNCGIRIEAVHHWHRWIARECQLVRVLCEIGPAGIEIQVLVKIYCVVKPEIVFLLNLNLKDFQPGHHSPMKHRYNHNIEGPAIRSFKVYRLRRQQD